MVDDEGGTLITLGFVVAAGLPLVVLVAAIVWPEPMARQAEVEQDTRDTYGDGASRYRRGYRSDRLTITAEETEEALFKSL
ncbi:hypothetical protein [Nocardia sp. NPDC024068]|uniref:hypothetical protein n=1 Tax=Nocardia sp. NPDC024068 TaxID=3157197 RepID=UPI00341041AB